MQQSRPMKNNEELTRFVQDLLHENIRPAKGLKPISYVDNHKLLDVKLLTDSDYQVANCWYNCLEHSLKHEGSPVFGWALWQMGENEFSAQHHAIWQSKTGDYLDLTPNGHSDTILFIPDGRAPFDYIGLRCPFNFRRKGSNIGAWYASDSSGGQFTAHEFSIAKCKPDNPDEVTRISNIIQLAKQRGLI
jgi:hypothetical protein